jgi:hypothetical protein
MNLKKIKIISVIGTFMLCFLTHFLYDIFPNSLFSIFFPVNESIWEHMKMLFTSILIFGIIEYFLLNKFKIKVNNYLFSLFLKAFLSIPIYLVMFLPFYYKFGEKMIVIFIMMIITFIIIEIISIKILEFKQIKYLNIISIILIIISYIIFGYLTYHPFKTHLFLDTENEKYGINDYNI